MARDEDDLEAFGLGDGEAVIKEATPRRRLLADLLKEAPRSLDQEIMAWLLHGPNADPSRKYPLSSKASARRLSLFDRLLSVGEVIRRGDEVWYVGCVAPRARTRLRHGRADHL